jgi:hypothetical protein
MLGGQPVEDPNDLLEDRNDLQIEAGAAFVTASGHGV